jgi:hypothetical protein
VTKSYRSGSKTLKNTEKTIFLCIFPTGAFYPMGMERKQGKIDEASVTQSSPIHEDFTSNH